MSSFAQMKQNRQSQLANLTTELEKTQTVTSYVDDRIWKCERDKSVMGMQLLDFYHLVKAKICHGYEYGIMDFKGQVDGTLKIH